MENFWSRLLIILNNIPMAIKKPKSMFPHDKTNATSGSITLGPGDAIPAGFAAFCFKATEGSAVMSKCNGNHYSGKELTDPCKIVGKDIGDVPHYVAGEINDITIDSGNITFYLIDDLNE